MSENEKNQEDKINEYDKLVVDISNNLTTRLSDLMSKLLNSSQDKLFNMSDEADNNEDQTRYFELMNQIRLLKPSIANTFNKKIKEYLVPAKDFESKQAKIKSSNDDELSLIDQDEMEGMVLVKGIGERASSKYREQLSHLEARFEHLALKTSNIFKKEALMPTNFCQAFDDALANDFSNADKKLLFGMFDIEVANKLEALYDSINNRLIDANVLPQIKLHMQGKKSSPPRTKPKQAAINADDQTQQNDFADSGYADSGSAQGAAPAGGYSAGSAQGMGTPGGGGSNIAGFAMTAAPGGAYRHTNQSSLQSQAGGAAGVAGSGAGGVTGGGAGGIAGSGSGAGGAAGVAGSGAGADGAGGVAGSGSGANGATGGGPGAGGVAGGAAGSSNQQSGAANSDNQGPSSGHSEYQHYTAGMPASHVGRVLGNYIGTPFSPDITDKSSENYGNFFPESTNQHFGHQEIIQALSNVQSLPQFVHPEETRFDSEAIKQAVVAEIAKTSGGAVTKRINQIAEKTIDFIELIFDAIIDDEDISDTIKTLLLRLQIPIIKASMTDQEFFIYDDHPARLVLDTIADVGVGISDHDDEIYKQLDKIVSGILGEYELNTETFQTALDKLNILIEEQETITRAKEEEAQQQLLRKHARATVLKALRATTTGKTLPEAVHPLILKRWPTLMFNHYLANGKENDAWVNIVFTLRHIIESVQPITSATSLAQLLTEKNALLEQTERYLNISSNSKKDVQNVMADYSNTLQQHIEDANFSEEEVSVAEETISHAEPVEEPPIEEEAVEKPVMPANVMPGMWFQIYMGEEQVPRRCKLSVIIVEDANLMFVNHKGELIVEKSFNEFSEEIASNKTKMIMGHSAFDHALKTVIDRLN